MLKIFQCSSLISLIVFSLYNKNLPKYHHKYKIFHKNKIIQNKNFKKEKIIIKIQSGDTANIVLIFSCFSLRKILNGG